MKKFCCVAVLMIAGSISAPAFAKDISEFSVGDIGCYDRLGPFNVIGRVVEINRSKEEILFENEKGKRTWYPAKKFRNVTLCKLTGAARDWAIDQGVELLSQ